MERLYTRQAPDWPCLLLSRTALRGTSLRTRQVFCTETFLSIIFDLDLSIKEQREVSSGAKGKTSTRAFMAIGVLLGEQHSFMHDLESFFWVHF
uniref:Fungal-type protein kinase domain-containing protein n=1 Tax=Bionectria ochroleuca TaxID=29856 RepID=A0A0B7KK89_BIOOC